MFYKKKGKPEIGELLICTVKKILPHSVFVSIDEYVNIDGMIYISEIAPGRIRNLRDYVAEGKKIVCKVLNINQHTGNIDLSIRRVGTSFMVQKLNEAKQEEKAEKLLQSIAKDLKIDLKGIYNEFGYKAIEKYGTLYNFFQEIAADEEKIKKEISIKPEIEKKLFSVVKEKIKPTEVSVSGTLSLQSYEENGVDDVKEILFKIEKNGIKVYYLGAPKYKLENTGIDLKEIDTKLKKEAEYAIEAIKKKKGSGEFIKGD